MKASYSTVRRRKIGHTRGRRDAGIAKSFLALTAVLILACAVPVRAGTWWDFTYSESDGNITITGYTGAGGDVDIPDTINGKPVITIGRESFRGNASLTTVTIPDSVTTIGDYAFSGCTGLTSVTFGESVTTIGNYAFRNCFSLANVTFPDSLTTIGNWAFAYCNLLTSVTIPDSVTTIGGFAFARTPLLTSVTIGQGITAIAQDTFRDCTGLTSVTIPDSVTYIGLYAFRNCLNLTSVTIPDSVTTIRDEAFRNCINLIEILVDEDNSAYSSLDGVLFNKDQSVLLQYPGGKPGDYIIPDSVTSIDRYAFAVSTGLTSVTIPDSVTTIGDYAFSGCSSLTSLTMGDGVTSIGNNAFMDCMGLTSLTIGDGVTTIGMDAFRRCSGLTSVTIPDSVTTIGDYAFSGCTGLTSVTIPDSVTAIGRSAFMGCTGLTNVAIGQGITAIAQDAFRDCTGLTSVTIPDSVTRIGDWSFYNCISLTSVTIPDSVTTIGSSAFQQCVDLTSVTIGRSVTNIEFHAFMDCSSLGSVYFRGNAPAHETGVFSGADNAVIYYMPETAGWGPEYAGRPTAPWAGDARIISPVRAGTIVAGDALRFAAHGPLGQYRWDFGDGRYSSTKVPGLVSFPAAGEYPIVMEYQDIYGTSAPVTDTITLTVVPDSDTTPDLKVTALDIPGAITVDQPFTISYTVRNVGRGPAAGGWRDAVYLSGDAHLDTRDELLGSSDIDDGLAVGASYQGEIEVTLPAVEEGAWHLILVADDQWQVLELHRLNNEYPVRVTARVPTLTAGEFSTVSYLPGQVEQYFRMTAAGGRSIQMDLSHLPAGLEVFVRYGSLPTRREYDHRFTAGGRREIPAATDGDWYLMVLGSMDEGGEYDIQFDRFDIILTGSSPSRHGQAIDLTLALTGAGFIPPLNVELVSATDHYYEAAEVEVDSFTRATATFDAGTLPVGTYGLRVGRNGLSAELPGVLEIFAVGEARLETDLILPANVGYNTLATLYVEYTNTGDAPMPAPLLMLSAIQDDRHAAILTLEHRNLARGFWASGMPQGFSATVQFLASGATPGVLQPGESGRVPVYYAGWIQPWDISPDRPPIKWQLSELHASDDTPVDWNELKDGLRPAHISEEAWAFVWGNFAALAGNTWGEYVAMLGRNARYLHRLDQRVENVKELMSFSLRMSEGFSPLDALTEEPDISVIAQGWSIDFERLFPMTLSRRFETGPLGRGWTHNWQIGFEVLADGTVLISNHAGGMRVFKPDVRFTGRFLAQAGDEGVLRQHDGDYRLTEKDGTVSGFGDGRLEYIEDTNNNRISCEYDVDGRLVRLVHSSGGDETGVFLELTYTAAGTIATVENNHGRRIDYIYDAGGEYLSVVRADDGRETRYSYQTDGAGTHAVTEVVRPDGSAWVYGYDAMGRLDRFGLRGDDPLWSVGHGPHGRVSVTNPLGQVSRYVFDHLGRLARTENPLGDAVQFGYDDLGRMTSVVDPEGARTVLGYDTRGNLTSFSDPLRRTSRFSHTHTLNRPAFATDPAGNRIDYFYDVRGNLLSVFLPDGTQESWTYDDRGNPVTWSNRRGGLVEYAYDQAGRLTGKRFPDGSETTYTYDARGNPANTVDSRGTTVFTYDEHDLLLQVDYPEGRRLEFSYDEAGRRVSSEDQLGYRLEYAYDEANRLARLFDDDGDVVTYTYDLLGRLSRVTLGNGVYTDYEYDAAGRMTSLINRDPEGEVLSEFVSTYDRRGHRRTMTTHYGTWTYQYDAAGQLVRAELESAGDDIVDQVLVYTYDALGNRVSTVVNGLEESYQANNLNQYVQVGERTYTYDLDGNLIREEGPDGITDYVYNDENRLVGVTRGGDVREYTYDALGNRAAVNENGAVTHYVIDPVGLGNVVGEYDADGELSARYIHGLGLAARMSDATGIGFYTFDPLAGTSEITDAGGFVRNSYAYRPFGEHLRNTVDLPNPFQFLGQYGVMADAGNTYAVRMRQYAPSTGRFMSLEPQQIGGGSLNFYLYGHNRPTTFVDVDGLEPVTLTLAAIGLKKLGAKALIWGGKKYFSYKAKCTAVAIGVGGACVKAGASVSAGVKGVGTSLLLTAMRNPTIMKALPLFVERALSSVFELLGVEGFPDGASTVTKYVKDGAGWIWDQLTGDSPTPEQTYTPLTPFPPSPPRLVRQERNTPVIASWDPNEKTTVAGFGQGNYVRSGSQLSYRIDFENYESATAPAQVVTIRDPLSEDLDWTTFEITEIGFGEIAVPVPAGRDYFETVVDYAYTDDDYDFEIEVNIEAWLENGVFSVNFLSIDPETGLPPPADIGFLPPETDPVTGRGRGYVSYLIRPEPDLPSGTAIRNIATIQFDFSLEIDTNQVDPLDKTQGTDPDKEALVSFDGTPPTSAVDALPAVTGTESFSVSWTGEDAFSGVNSYDVYVSVNGGGWQVWTNTASTAADFAGEDGVTYAFYSVATDNVGHREEKVAAAEATTTVQVGDEVPPVVGITEPTSEATWTSSSATVNIAGTASDNVGVTRVTVVNDRDGMLREATGTTSWHYHGLPLLAGENVITVTAHDAAGNSATATIAVTYEDPDPDIDLRPTLAWDAVEGATWYQLWINRDGRTHHHEWIADVSEWTPEADLPHGAYRWWVRAWGAGIGMRGWVAGDGFDIPFASNPLSPSGNVALEDRRPVFMWEHVGPEALWTHLWLNRDGRPHLSQWVSNASEWRPDAALPAGQYAWWVRPWNRAGLGAWSGTATFRIEAQLPGALTQIAPVGAQDSHDLTYRWEQDANATWYRLWVGRAGAGTWYDGWHAFAGAGTAEVELANHPAGTFTWWLLPWGPDGSGPWSGPGQFTTPSQAPMVPELMAPLGETVENPPTFAWESERADWYRVYVQRIGSGAVIDQWTADATLTPAAALPAGQYAWWVGAWNRVTGRVVWSQRGDFSIQSEGHGDRGI